MKDGQPTAEPSNIRHVLRIVRRLYGTTPAKAFGPLALKAVRDEMVRAGNCRTEINRRVGRIIWMSRWGVSEELVLPSVLEALRAVAGLRRGRSAVREKAPIRPVPDDDVEATIPHLCSRVRAMVELQRLTGMRPGEVVLMRTGNLDMAATSGRMPRPGTRRSTTAGRGRSLSVRRGRLSFGPGCRPTGTRLPV